MADTTTTVELLLQARDLATGSLDKLGESLARLHEHLSLIKDIALGNILGNLGMSGIDDLTRGVVDLGKGMISTNADIELMRQRLNILYQSTAEGAQAFAFLKQNELTKPFNIADIMQASVQLVAFKQNIVQVLPALEDVAGAMGQTLPVAAQAFTDAMAGRFQMMKRDLGISKEELVQFGLQMNKAGHITDPNSFVSAFLALANSSQFKGGADKMAQTWTGLMSSMSSQWTYFQANIGAGAFSVLEKQLSGLVHTLQNPGNAQAIQNIETQIGAGLATMTVEAINFGKAIGPYVGSAIALVARAWPLVEQGASIAFTFVGGVVSLFANWLQNTGFPIIEKVINALADAWYTLEPVVGRVLLAIGTDVSNFAGAVAGISEGLLSGLAGAFQIGMGAVEVIFGGSLDLMSGNWAQFQNDVNGGSDVIVKGMVEMVGGISIALLPLANLLLGPWTQLAIGVRNVVEGIGQLVGALVGSVVYAAANMDAVVINAMNTMLNAVGDTLGHLPGFLHPGISDSQVKAMMRGAAVGTIDPNTAAAATEQTITAWFNQHAPGINSNQQIIAGRTEAQAAADINARTAQILREVGIAQGTAHGQVFGTSSGPGADVLKEIKALFKDLGGKFTLADLLKAFGLKDMGHGALAYSPPGSLPVLGVGPTADSTAAALGGVGGLASTSARQQRVTLGQLGATFMQTMATTGGGLGRGNPHEVKVETQGDLLVRQGDKNVSQNATTIDLLTHAATSLGNLERAFAKLVLPAPPVTPLARSRGIARPRAL
jgi:hypothetical protein